MKAGREIHSKGSFRIQSFIVSEDELNVGTFYGVRLDFVFTNSDFSNHDHWTGALRPSFAGLGRSNKKSHKTQHEEIVCLS